MRKMIFLFVATLCFHAHADFIIKYRSGKMVKSKVDPTMMNSLAISSSNEEVEYIEEDTWLQSHSSFTNDPYYTNQWALSSYLNNSFAYAWQQVSGAASIVVAVVDTGITYHSDLNSRIVGGYDFISDSDNSRDGGGRDSDPSDPGDYGDSLTGCSSAGSNSSWHGTHIAGIIAANSNNNYGVAGSGSSNIKISPLRVLGPCGGQTSDIADAIRWAAGGSVSGVPSNSNKAKVINLSLGGRASCSQYMQEAIDYANSRGSVVVVSAGNDSANVDYMEYTPANCRGVFRVGAVDTSVSSSSYSNYGNIVDISAPGDMIYSTVNSGSTSPSFDSFSAMSGTSMSAGFISATAAMVFSANPSLYSEQVKDIMVRTSQSFTCHRDSCSQGVIDPYYAVTEAVSQSADPDFTYDDPVVVGGYRSVGSSNTVKVTNSGGGACGTISYGDGGDSGNFSHTALALMALFLSLNFLIRAKRTTRKKLRS